MEHPVIPISPPRAREVHAKAFREVCYGIFWLGWASLAFVLAYKMWEMKW